jgi:hypothetical protein
MNSLNNIPNGWHATTVQWRPGEADGDLVCIVETKGQEIQFVNWLGAATPAGYYVLYQNSSLDTTFRGCRRWEILNGNYTCYDSWTVFQMRKNPVSKKPE